MKIEIESKVVAPSAFNPQWEVGGRSAGNEMLAYEHGLDDGAHQLAVKLLDLARSEPKKLARVIFEAAEYGVKIARR